MATKDEIDLEKIESAKKLNKAMDKLRHGDDNAMSIVYFETKNLVFSIVLNILKNIEDAKDIMQETYLQVYESINSYQPETNARAWILKIARNKALNMYQSNKKYSYIDLNQISDTIKEEKVEIEKNNLTDLILKNLDEKNAKIVLMHTIGGLKHKEIAKMLEMPEGTVRYNYNISINKIKSLYRKEF